MVAYHGQFVCQVFLLSWFLLWSLSFADRDEDLLVKTHPAIDFGYGASSPEAGIPRESFLRNDIGVIRRPGDSFPFEIDNSRQSKRDVSSNSGLESTRYTNLAQALGLFETKVASLRSAHNEVSKSAKDVLVNTDNYMKDLQAVGAANLVASQGVKSIGKVLKDHMKAKIVRLVDVVDSTKAANRKGTQEAPIDSAVNTQGVSPSHEQLYPVDNDSGEDLNEKATDSEGGGDQQVLKNQAKANVDRLVGVVDSKKAANRKGTQEALIDSMVKTEGVPPGHEQLYPVDNDSGEDLNEKEADSGVGGGQASVADSAAIGENANVPTDASPAPKATSGEGVIAGSSDPGAGADGSMAAGGDDAVADVAMGDRPEVPVDAADASEAVADQDPPGESQVPAPGSSGSADQSAVLPDAVADASMDSNGASVPEESTGADMSAIPADAAPIPVDSTTPEGADELATALEKVLQGNNDVAPNAQAE